MSEKLIQEKSLTQWFQTHPLLLRLVRHEEVSWWNQGGKSTAEVMASLPLDKSDIEAAAARLSRFAPFIAKVFPETKQSKGLIESPLRAIPNMKAQLEVTSGRTLPGSLLLKCDNLLPIAGSIKARGGIYEVLKRAETLALEAGLVNLNDDYAKLDSAEYQAFFSRYTIVVGSTGNLGLSIGIISAQLGFQVTVHMSADARQWKKDLLTEKGVLVVEHEDDYSKAVEQGREEAACSANSFFIDDENSQDLFLGYSVAALRLEQQLKDSDIVVDEQHPLFVYLPCGVGGAPGGVAFGLKQIFGDHVHCLFAEPTHSPCMLLGMYTGLHDKICVQDLEIDNRTCADGLAVGRPSAFVGQTMAQLIHGIYTVEDDELMRLLALMKDTEDISLEPSALAGLPGIVRVLEQDKAELQRLGLWDKMANATHIAWATGGSLLPDVEQQEYYRVGKSLLGS